MNKYCLNKQKLKISKCYCCDKTIEEQEMFEKQFNTLKSNLEQLDVKFKKEKLEELLLNNFKYQD